MPSRWLMSPTAVRVATNTLVACTALGLLIVACDARPTSGPTAPTGSIGIDVTVVGDGRATFAPVGFDCSDACTLVVDDGTDVALAAVPNSGRVLVAWDGPCDPFDDTCAWTVEGDRAVTVTFAPHALRFDLVGDGEGSFHFFIGEFIECDSACGLAFEQPLDVSINHRVDTGNRTLLEPWEADCIGVQSVDFCVVHVEGLTVVGKTWRHPPRAADHAYTTNQGTPLPVPAPGVLAGVGDTPGDTHTAMLDVEPGNGSIELEVDGSFAYLPANGFAGVDTFTFRVSDAFGNTDAGTATVTVWPLLTLEKHGAGNVSSDPPGIACDAACATDGEHFDWHTAITLTAEAEPGTTFQGWAGDACDGDTDATCNVTMDGPKVITATFSAQLYVLDVSRSGSGTGSITSDPEGISISPSQARDIAAFAHGIEITLIADPVGHSVFSLWRTGPCAGSGDPTCTFTITEDIAVDATFTRTRLLSSIDSTVAGDAGGRAAQGPDRVHLDEPTRASTTGALPTSHERWAVRS